MMDFFSDKTSLALTKTLDAVGLRHRVIANNIANVETPRFTRSEVSFEGELAKALEPGSSSGAVKNRIRELEPKIQLDTNSPAKPDGNNVSIDKEMAELNKNSIEYDALIQLVNLKGSMIKTAITGGR